MERFEFTMHARVLGTRYRANQLRRQIVETIERAMEDSGAVDKPGLFGYHLTVEPLRKAEKVNDGKPQENS